MGATETYSRGVRFAVERPGALLLAVAIVALSFDLLLKLLDTELFFLGVKLLGGSVGTDAFGTVLLDGLTVGVSVGLAGIGLSMTYSILSFANFAHGDTLTAGAFMGWVVAFLLAGLFGAGGDAGGGTLLLLDATPQIGIIRTPLIVLVGLVAAAVATIGLSLLLDRIVYRPLRDADGISLLIASIGVALALRYLVAFVWQTSSKSVTPIPLKVTLLGTITMSGHQFALLVIGVALMLGMHVLLQYTKLGKAMRAMADNKDLARVTGIPTERIIRLTWVIGGGLTGIAGFLIGLERGVIIFNFGWLLLLLIFAAVILGGIGSIYGAMVGGVIVGVVQALSQIWIPSELTKAAAFLVLIVVLLVRPDGIFGGVTTA
jgi:branched-chain amino acid transport system permease protein